jgi:hypothetical protein
MAQADDELHRKSKALDFVRAEFGTQISGEWAQKMFVAEDGEPYFVIIEAERELLKQQNPKTSDNKILKELLNLPNYGAKTHERMKTIYDLRISYPEEFDKLLHGEYKKSKAQRLFAQLANEHWSAVRQIYIGEGFEGTKYKTAEGRELKFQQIQAALGRAISVNVKEVLLGWLRTGKATGRKGQHTNTENSAMTASERKRRRNDFCECVFKRFKEHGLTDEERIEDLEMEDLEKILENIFSEDQEPTSIEQSQ